MVKQNKFIRRMYTKIESYERCFHLIRRKTYRVNPKARQAVVLSYH